MFDLDLIEHALARKVSVSELANARIEFAKLRKAMEEASERTVYESTGNEGLGHITRIRKALVGHRVLLVKADD